MAKKRKSEYEVAMGIHTYQGRIGKPLLEKDEVYFREDYRTNIEAVNGKEGPSDGIWPFNLLFNWFGCCSARSDPKKSKLLGSGTV
jgi:hypothetical protein